MKRIYKSLPQKIVIFSGAGLSAESGISTFRDSNGLWENHKIEEICNERTWKSNPDKSRGSFTVQEMNNNG